MTIPTRPGASSSATSPTSTAITRRRPRPRARIAGILLALTARLEQQRKRSSRFFIGDAPTALDIYWATFAVMNDPLPDDLCLLSPAFRRVYTNTDPTIRSATAPILLEHRDFIYRDFLELPLDF